MTEFKIPYIAVGFFVLTVGLVLYFTVFRNGKAAAPALDNKHFKDAADPATELSRGHGSMALPHPASTPNGDDEIQQAVKSATRDPQLGDTNPKRAWTTREGGSFDLPAFLCGTGPAAPQCVSTSVCVGDF